MRCYTKQFFVQLVSHFCCDASCAKNCHVSNLLPQALQKVELDFTYRNDCSNDFIDFLPLRSVTPNVTPRATCLAMLCLVSQSGSLLSSPRSSSVAFLRAVPLHSVTPLFVQCETICTKNCLGQSDFIFLFFLARMTMVLNVPLFRLSSASFVHSGDH